MPTPSLLIVPARFKSGKLYSQIPTSGAGDFTVTRATAATRVNASGFIESVASGIPRLDYFASGGTVGCPALLVEPAATNLCLQSTDTTTSWLLGANLTSGAIDVIGVSGIALTVAASGSNLGVAAGCHRVIDINATLTSGSTYTISFLLKKTASYTIGGFVANTSGATQTSFGSGFDISGSFSSGSIAATSPVTNRIRRVERFGTDVFRCSETFTMTATNVLTVLRLGLPVSVTDITNSAVGTQLGFAAPQIELGSVPTSFIPTTTGSVTRNAEVISVSGAVSGSIGQTEGTIYAEVAYSAIPVTKAIIAITDGTTNNRIAVRLNAPTQISATVVVSSTSYALNQTIPAIPSSGILKIALAYKANDYIFAVNGTTYADTTTRPVPATSAVILGSNGFNADFFNDRIRAAALYTTRLTNAELQSLTTP